MLSLRYILIVHRKVYIPLQNMVSWNVVFIGSWNLQNNFFFYDVFNSERYKRKLKHFKKGYYEILINS